MRYDTEYQGTELEVRILGLENTVATLTNIIRSLHDTLAHLTDTTAEHVDRIGSVLAHLPSTTSRAWPGLPTLVWGERGAGKDTDASNCGCACATNDTHTDDTP